MKKKSLLVFFLAGVLSITIITGGLFGEGSGLLSVASAGVGTGTTGTTTSDGSATATKTPAYPELGASAPTATAACTDVAGSAGMIPCGRYINDPATAWDECKACDFCSIPLALQLVMDFAIKIVGVVAVLAIVLGQLLAMTAVGQTDMMIKIKSVLGSALMGFGYVLAAWLVVNSILAFAGYTDPLGGEWYTVC